MYPECYVNVSRVLCECIQSVMYVNVNASQVFCQCIAGVLSMHRRCLVNVSQVFGQCIAGVLSMYHTALLMLQNCNRLIGLRDSIIESLQTSHGAATMGWQPWGGNHGVAT